MALEIEVIVVAFLDRGDLGHAAIHFDLPAIRQMARLPIKRIKDDESALSGVRLGCQSEDSYQ